MTDTRSSTDTTGLLRRARQFIADAGCDEDDHDVNLARDELLTEIDAMLSGGDAQAVPLPDLARIMELRVFEHGGFRAIVDGVGGWGKTQRAAIENATENAEKLNASAVSSTTREIDFLSAAQALTDREDRLEECERRQP
jgi:hypothetical protein